MERYLLLNSWPSNHYLNAKTRFAFSVVEILYENVLLTKMLSNLKVAKKHMHVYCFHGKHFLRCDLRGMLETDNFAQKDSKQTISCFAVFRAHGLLKIACRDGVFLHV